MKLSIHLNFNGNAEAAMKFYESVFGTSPLFVMPWKDAPEQTFPLPEGWGSKVMHASLPLGTGLLMACDAPPNGEQKPMQGFQVSVELKDQAEAKRVYDALAEGGTSQMPMAPTFWSPLFGMCTDKFGIAWMVSVPGSPNA